MNHQQPAREPPATPRTPAAGGTTAAPLSAPGDRIEGRRVFEGDEMSTMAETKCTDEQKAEWHALHEQMRELRDERETAQRMAAGFLADHVAAGAMTPGEFGLPSCDAMDSYRSACEYAAKAKRLEDEWQALYDQCEAHPYTAEVNARRGQQ